MAFHNGVAMTGAGRVGVVAGGSAALNGLAVLFALALAVAAMLTIGAPVVVVDGDTVDRGLVRYRLAGFDAPEIRRARCPSEKAAGLAAKSRLAELIAAAGEIALVPIKARDPYGRVIARLDLDGADVAGIAIAEGWGHAYAGRGKRDWCA